DDDGPVPERRPARQRPADGGNILVGEVRQQPFGLPAQGTGPSSSARTGPGSSRRSPRWPRVRRPRTS
ncbi:hypothetical protein, partial [Amycolatopsis lexingtonensis]|uniref:hypothetical protein n=1 Tax=Amycolatopsis lexingtonensis TaxID=218822 RepID=UPI001B806815